MSHMCVLDGGEKKERVPFSGLHYFIVTEVSYEIIENKITSLTFIHL